MSSNSDRKIISLEKTAIGIVSILFGCFVAWVAYANDSIIEIKSENKNLSASSISVSKKVESMDFAVQKIKTDVALIKQGQKYQKEQLDRLISMLERENDAP